MKIQARPGEHYSLWADDGAYESLCHYPGGYAKTLRGIRLLREQEVDVKVGGSLTPVNQKDLDRLLDLEQELECRCGWTPTCCLQSGSGPFPTTRSPAWSRRQRPKPDPCPEAGDGARSCSPSMFFRRWSRRTARSRGRKRRYRWPAWRDGVPLPLTGRGRCGPASS